MGYFDEINWYLRRFGMTTHCSTRAYIILYLSNIMATNAWPGFYTEGTVRMSEKQRTYSTCSNSKQTLHVLYVKYRLKFRYRNGKFKIWNTSWKCKGKEVVPKQIYGSQRHVNSYDEGVGCNSTKTTGSNF